MRWILIEHARRRATDKRGRDQVMVKVVVSEVSRKAIKQLGINSTGEWKLGKFSLTPTIDNPFALSPQALSASAIGAGIVLAHA